MEATGFEEKRRAPPTSSSPARAGSTPRRPSARPRSASPVERRAAGVPCVAVGGGVEPEGVEALADVGAIAVPVWESPMSLDEAIAAGRNRWSAAANGSPGGSRRAVSSSREPASRSPDARSHPRPVARRPGPPRPARDRRRAAAGGIPTPRRAPGRSASRATGPGSCRSCSTALTERYGRPTWERRLDPTTELVLTILTQNTADVNAEKAFEALREAYPSGGRRRGASTRRRLGRRGPGRRAHRRTGPPSRPRRSPS